MFYVLCTTKLKKIWAINSWFCRRKRNVSFFFNLEIVDRSISVWNEFINSNKIKSITSNSLSLIIQKRIRFSFDLKNVSSITQRKASNKDSKDWSFKIKKLFKKLNDLFRFEIKNQVVLFEWINKLIQKNEEFVDVLLFILVVVKIM